MNRTSFPFGFFSLFGMAAADFSQQTQEVAEQLASLQAMCAETGQAREQRHEQRPLYERLGGYERILTLTREIVRLHNENDNIKSYFKGVDSESLARLVADFMAAGTGGETEYTGRSMVDVHRTMGLSDGDFLSAGGDVIQAMENLGYGQDEIDEVVCILVSLKDKVVLS